MPSSIALSALRSLVLQRANMENTEFVTTSELNSIINGEGAELHDLVISRFEDQFTINTTFTISPGSSTFDLTSLPSTAPFYKFRGLDYQVGNSSDWYPVHKFQWNSRDRRLSARQYFLVREIQYRLVGSNIVLTPTDGAYGTYQLWYIPAYVDLVIDADTLTYPQNWYEFIVAGSAAKCLAKEESDASIQLGLKSAAQQRILAMASNRDAGAPERVERVRNHHPYSHEECD